MSSIATSPTLQPPEYAAQLTIWGGGVCSGVAMGAV